MIIIDLGSFLIHNSITSIYSYWIYRTNSWLEFDFKFLWLDFVGVCHLVDDNPRLLFTRVQITQWHVVHNFVLCSSIFRWYNGSFFLFLGLWPVESWGSEWCTQNAFRTLELFGTCRDSTWSCTCQKTLHFRLLLIFLAYLSF